MEQLNSSEGFQVDSLFLDWVSQLIKVVVRDAKGRTVAFTFAGPTALALMRALNKADLSAKSLHRRVLERLVTDGRLADGTFAGLPD